MISSRASSDEPFLPPEKDSILVHLVYPQMLGVLVGHVHVERHPLVNIVKKYVHHCWWEGSLRLDAGQHG
jgi:hypothetical protein